MQMVAQDVNEAGQLVPGTVYRRKDLHKRFGGNRYAGIASAKREGVVLLFHTEEPSQQFYQDGFDESGIYWYSGEGTLGDMEWTAANRAIRDHESDGHALLLFERAQRKDGLWKYCGAFHYIEHRMATKPDKEGNQRAAIVFGLLPLHDESCTSSPERELATPLPELRRLAIERASLSPTSAARIAQFYLRAEAVHRYALARAIGICEACGDPAPFDAHWGPFLEVHHLTRLVDGGPDCPQRVAAICPNCHRRCHYAIDALEYNELLRERIDKKEAELTAR